MTSCMAKTRTILPQLNKLFHFLGITRCKYNKEPNTLHSLASPNRPCTSESEDEPPQYPTKPCVSNQSQHTEHWAVLYRAAHHRPSDGFTPQDTCRLQENLHQASNLPTDICSYLVLHRKQEDQVIQTAAKKILPRRLPLPPNPLCI